METVRDVAREDNDRLQDHWEESVILPEEYNSYRQPILDMLGHFSDMWDGHLARMEASRHRIELTSSDVRPIHSAPYRAGPKARIFEKEELDKMMKMGVIELAHTEWAQPMVFAPNKGGSLGFASTTASGTQLA